MPKSRNQEFTMPTPMNDSGHQTIANLIESCRQELDQLQAEILEIEVLVKQTQAEIERLSPRLSQITRKVHEVESQPDAFSRAEVKETYGAAQEAQMRSFVMQAQLEQLKHKKTSLQRYDSLLRRVLTTLDHNYDHDETTGSAGSSNQRRRAADAPPAFDDNSPVLAKVIEAQEHERYRVSQEIHDGPAQMLANLALRAELCEKLMLAKDERTLEELRQIKRSIAKSLRDIRQLAYELRPIVIGELGLVVTLQKYLQGVSDQTNIATAVESDQFDPELPEHLQLTLFRVIQDAIQQSLTRPQVSRLIVRLGTWEDQVGIEIEDDGVLDHGRQSTKMDRDQRPKLVGLPDRLRLLGALTESETVADQGNILRIAIPRP